MAKIFFTKETFKDTIGNLSERIGWNMKCLREDGKVEKWRVKRHSREDAGDIIEVGRYIINVPLIGTAVYPNGETELDALWNTIADDLRLRPYVQNKKELDRVQYDYPKATPLLTGEQAEKVAKMMLQAATYDGTKMTLCPIISHKQHRDENNRLLADELLTMLTAEGAEVTRQDIIEELEYSQDEGGFLSMSYRFSTETINRLRDKYQTAPYFIYKPDRKPKRIVLFEGSYDVTDKCVSGWTFHRIDPSFVDCYSYSGQNGSLPALRQKLRWMREEEEINFIEPSKYNTDGWLAPAK